MATPQMKRFDTPDETRSFPNGRADLVSLDGNTFMLLTFEPGFRWSTSIKPQVNTQSCQSNHLWYVVSGRMHIKMDDGSEGEFGPGEAVSIPAGHDGWTIGDEPAVLLDVRGADQFAQ